jgi:AcrR family transcriptional regulator
VATTPRRAPGEPTAKPAVRDRPNSRGESTRLLILKKAEELFAHQGIAAVPLRDIGVAAGQKNNVAVQYHFGDKENLLREITAHRARVSEERRAELLADLLAAGKPPEIADLVRSWIDALAYHLGEDNYYLAFLSRYFIERGGSAAAARLPGHPGGGALDGHGDQRRPRPGSLPDRRPGRQAPGAATGPPGGPGHLFRRRPGGPAEPPAPGRRNGKGQTGLTC